MIKNVCMLKQLLCRCDVHTGFCTAKIRHFFHFGGARLRFLKCHALYLDRVLHVGGVAENAAEHFLAGDEGVLAESSEGFLEGVVGHFLGFLLHEPSGGSEVDLVGAAVGVVGEAADVAAFFHALKQPGHGGLVLVGGHAELLLGHAVLLCEIEEHSPLAGGEVDAGVGKILLQLAVDGGRDFSVEDGEYEPQIDIEFHMLRVSLLVAVC